MKVLTVSSSFCRSQIGRVPEKFAAINDVFSSTHRSNVAVALNPITEKTTTPANIEVPQFVIETNRASR